MFEQIKRDIRVVFERDPAARSVWEVILCYPGVHAIWTYRVAHWFWTRGYYLLGRLISHMGRMLTGIEIHPGATLGPGLFIDHGMGVVIGETAEVGENVTLYQGVTLGGTSLKKEKRHPTIGRNVVIGSGAKILGGFKIGDNSKIGSGSVVIREVPPNSTVVGVPGKIVYQNGQKIVDGIDLNHHLLPDPVAKAIELLLDRVQNLEQEVSSLKKALESSEARPESPVELGG